jgi:selenocysteine-specific elongation factor
MDVPGHKDYLRNAVRGLSFLEGAVLVVAADDGVMAQTKDHLDILQWLGARAGMVVLSKSDRVDEETLEYARLEIEELVAGTFLHQCPIIPFSAVDGRGIGNILNELEHLGRKLGKADSSGPCRLWIDRVRNVAGHGTVVSGTLISGVLRKDDPLTLLPSGKLTRARSLEWHHVKVQQAVGGQRVGVNLHHISLDEVSPGMLLAQPGTVDCVPYVNVVLHLSPHAPRGLVHQQKIRLHMGTACVQGRAIFLETAAVKPGSTVIAQIRLERPLPCLAGDHFVLTFLDDYAVAGGGRILEPTGEKLRGAKASRMLPYLQCLERKDLEKALEHLFSRNPYTPLSAFRTALLTGFRSDDTARVLDRWVQEDKLVCIGDHRYVRKKDYAALRRKFHEALVDILSSNPLKEWVPAEELRARVDMKLDPDLTRHLLSDLCDRNLVERGEGGYRLPHRVRQWSPRQKEMMEAIFNLVHREGLSSFAAGTIADMTQERFDRSEIQRILDYLAAQRLLIRFRDGRYMNREAFMEAQSRVCSWIRAKGAMRLSECSTVLGYGRNRATALLEHLDAMGVTIRRGDERILAEDYYKEFWRLAKSETKV